MQDKITIHQKTREISFILIFAGMLAAPLYTTGLLLAAKYCKQEVERKRYFLIGLASGGIAILMYIVIYGVGVYQLTFLTWLFGLDTARGIVVIGAAGLFSMIDYSKTADDWMLEEEQKKTANLMARDLGINFDNRSHIFVAGTTGAGKTTLLLQYIDDSMKKGEPLFILSGKNGTDDPFSLLNSVKKLAKRYGRELRVVSTNLDEPERVGYNPLQNMTVTELSDALCNASEFTEPHYKYCLATWIKAIGECLQIMNIPFSLQAIVDFYDWNSFLELVNAVKEKVPDEKIQGYLRLEDICKTAALSRSRFMNMLFGEGAEVWSDDGICAKQCRDRNAVFFCDLDAFRYNDFTQFIGKFFASDIRNIISSEKHPEQKKRIVMDELSAYASEQILPLFNQSRAYGYQVIVATQSIADIRAVSEDFSERILENCGQYGVLQLNSSEDAEEMAKLIGTRLVIETTRKSQGAFLDSAATGSKKIVNQFKVSPDAIKELRPLEVVLYNKKEPEKVQLLKLKYVS